ncbi:MAG TPA: glutamyl-tRNA reductase [Acidimicrobiales bacterium]
MSVVVIGLNHRTVPLDLLERTTVATEGLPKALADLCSRPNVREAVVLSTCNRTEVYAVAEKFHGAYQDIRDFFCDLAGLAPEDLHPHLYSQHDEDAVAHLFEVAAGLDSDVIGESEILGQVRAAWEQASAEGSARSALNLLFRHAVEVGKRARTETGIGRGTASVSFAAVEMAREHLGGLTDRSVLVLGAGEMGEGMAVALAGAGVGHMLVANRTRTRADSVAERVGGRSVAFADAVAAVSEVDLLLTSMGSGSILIERSEIAAAMARRPDRPLLVVDVAVPRDVDHGVATVPNVTLLDLDDLRDWAERALSDRRAEAGRVREIVGAEVRRYVDVATARQVAPLVAALHERFEQARIGELERFGVHNLDDRDRALVEAVTRGLVAKLLHDPSVRLKDDAGTPRGERNAAALRDLFDLS